MPIVITGWEGVCFVPGDGQPDENGRVTVMTTHTSPTVESAELAWEEAIKLGDKHNARDFLAVQPITTKQNRPRRLITIAIYEDH